MISLINKWALNKLAHLTTDHKDDVTHQQVSYKLTQLTTDHKDELAHQQVSLKINSPI